MLTRLLKAFKKILKAKKGYTLVEVASVVAITATLAAVAVPVAINKIEEGKQVAALQDVQSVSAAIQSLFKDTGDWPVRETSAQDDKWDLLFSSASTSGTPGNQKTSYSFNGTANTFLAADIDSIYNHLIENKVGYDDDEWLGPYLSEDKLDPWGNSYIAYVRFLKKQSVLSTLDPSEGYVWVISAGPDQEIDTDVDDEQTVDDDIGIKMK